MMKNIQCRFKFQTIQSRFKYGSEFLKMGAGRAHFAHLLTLPISPIFSEFNPAQESHAAHFAHFTQRSLR
jgi:hypothetical protein